MLAAARWSQVDSNTSEEEEDEKEWKKWKKKTVMF